MKIWTKFAVVLVVMVLFFGCAGTSQYMRDVPPGISYAPKSNEAVVVFMRPSKFAFAINAGVFDVSTPETKVIGIVSATKKVAYRTKPGKHLFMVTGESADFMQADLKPGKTYYSLVNPRMGAWKARFSLGAVHRNIDTAKLNAWKNGCRWSEATDATYEWAQQNAPSIQKKREGYIVKWNSKPETSRPTLHTEDGF
jgi:hypothetical protein